MPLLLPADGPAFASEVCASRLATRRTVHVPTQTVTHEVDCWLNWHHDHDSLALCMQVVSTPALCSASIGRKAGHPATGVYSITV
eukprot:702159-Rhodomonas_salina.1